MVSWLLAVTLAQAVTLSEPHQAWLDEEVRFVISKRERQEFLALDSDEARDRFIQNFWLRRDPTAGTAKNEARETHLARLEEADRLFTLIAANPGRFTERGRIYQLLGPPEAREDYTFAGNRLFPLELWHYTGITERFLPGTFYLIFFRDGGFGDYRMWNPTTDGPQALVQSHEPGRFLLDESFAYEELKRVDMELAQAVERLVPGDGRDLPHFAAESLLTNLINYADIEERYRRLDEQVRARITFQQLGVLPLAAVIFDSTGIPQVHYALEIPSSVVQWDTVEGRFQASFGVICRMLDEQGREVDVIEDWLDLDLSAEQKDSLGGEAISFQGRLILPAGRFTLEFTLTSTPGATTDVVSVPVEVPKGVSDGASQILLARSRTRIPSGEFLDNRPFQIEGYVVNPSTDGIFPADEALAYLQIPAPSASTALYWTLSGKDGESSWEGKTELLVGPGEAGSIVTTVVAIPLTNLADGNYTLAVRLPGAGREVPITVEASRRPQTVQVLSRESLPAGDGRIRYRRGILFARIGDTMSAVEEMAAAADLMPRDLEVHLKLAFLLNATGQYERVIEVLTPIAPHYPNEPDLLVFLGFASLKLGRNDDAAGYLKRALAQRPDDERLEAALAQARDLAKSASKP